MKCIAILERKFLVPGLFGDFLFYELKLKLGKGFANKNFPPNFDFHRSHSQLNGWIFPYIQVGISSSPCGYFHISMWVFPYLQVGISSSPGGYFHISRWVFPYIQVGISISSGRYFHFAGFYFHLNSPKTAHWENPIQLLEYVIPPATAAAAAVSPKSPRCYGVSLCYA